MESICDYKIRFSDVVVVVQETDLDTVSPCFLLFVAMNYDETMNTTTKLGTQ